MESKLVKTKELIIWSLIIGHLLLISNGAVFMIMHWPYWELFMAFGFSFLLSSWAIILFEIIHHNIDNRKYWLVSMFILPNISPVYYMIRREKLIKSEVVEIEGGNI